MSPQDLLNEHARKHELCWSIGNSRLCGNGELEVRLFSRDIRKNMPVFMVRDVSLNLCVLECIGKHVNYLAEVAKKNVAGVRAKIRDNGKDLPVAEKLPGLFPDEVEMLKEEFREGTVVDKEHPLDIVWPLDLLPTEKKSDVPADFSFANSDAKMTGLVHNTHTQEFWDDV